MSLEPWTVCLWRPLWVTTTAHSTPTIGHPCRCKIHIIEQSLEEEKRESTNHSLSQIPPVHNRTLGHWIGHPRLDIVVLQHFGEFLFHYFGQFHYFTSFTGVWRHHCNALFIIRECATMCISSCLASSLTPHLEQWLELSLQSVEVQCNPFIRFLSWIFCSAMKTCLQKWYF